MPTPFSQAPRDAALQGLRDRATPQGAPPSGPVPQAVSGQVPGQAGGAQVVEAVGAQLAQVLQMIASAPPEVLQPVIQQVEQFFLALQELSQGVPGIQQAPQGQAPQGPAPQGRIPQAPL